MNRAWIAFICLCMGAADATTVKPFVFDGLCGTAQTIAHVRCVESVSLTYPDREGLFTRTRFEVLQAVKGVPGRELVLVLPGGTVQGRRMEVFGIPRFEIGQETVLFLSEPDAFGFPWPVGLGQGCYGVEASAEGTRHVAMGEGVPLPPGVLGKPATPAHMELGGFLDLVRQRIQAAPENHRDER